MESAGAHEICAIHREKRLNHIVETAEQTARALAGVGLFEHAIALLTQAAAEHAGDEASAARIDAVAAAIYLESARERHRIDDQPSADRAVILAAHHARRALATELLAPDQVADCLAILLRARLWTDTDLGTLLNEHASCIAGLTASRHAPTAALLRALVAAQRGDLTVARADLEQARLTLGADGDAALGAAAAVALAEVCARQGDFAAAYQAQHEACGLEAHVRAAAERFLQSLGVLAGDLPDNAATPHQQAVAILASLRHELATPAGAILNFARLLIKPRYGELTDGQRRLQRRIVANTEYLLLLLASAIDLARIRSDMLVCTFSACDLHEILAESLANIATLTDQFAVQLDIPPGLPLVRADQVRLRQALHGLLLGLGHHVTSGTIMLRAELMGGRLELQAIATGWSAAELLPESPSESSQLSFGPKISGPTLLILLCQGLIKLQDGEFKLMHIAPADILARISLPLAEPDVVRVEPSAPAKRTDPSPLEAAIAPELLDQLLDLARLGDMSSLRQLAKTQVDAYPALIGELLRLIDAFEDRQIIALLERQQLATARADHPPQ